MNNTTGNTKGGPLKPTIDEEKEFLNITNYENVHYVKQGGNIYIGQVQDSEPPKKGNLDNAVVKKGEEKIKEEAAVDYEQKEKSQRKKKKNNDKIVKEGCGIMLKTERNENGEEVLASKFIGNWKNDKREGLGLQVFPNRNRFYGNFANNAMEGWGHLEGNNSFFEGIWSNNMASGKGLFENRLFSHKGKFYRNKFIRSDGTWVNIFDPKLFTEDNTKKNNTSLKETDESVNKKFNALFAPFDFFKNNLGRMYDLVNGHFNNIPVLLLSKQFAEKNENFDLAKYIFASFYLESDEKLMKHVENLYLSKNWEKKPSVAGSKELNAEQKPRGTEGNIDSVEENQDLESSDSGSDSPNRPTSPQDTPNSKRTHETHKIYDNNIKDSKNKNILNDLSCSLNKFLSSTSIPDFGGIDGVSCLTQKSIDAKVHGAEGDAMMSADTLMEAMNRWVKEKTEELRSFIENNAHLFLYTDDGSSKYIPDFSKFEYEKEKYSDKSKKEEATKEKTEADDITGNTSASDNKEELPSLETPGNGRRPIKSEEELQREINKIKINISLLDDMEKLRIPCEFFIKVKIINAYTYDYPMIVSLNVNEENKTDEPDASSSSLLQDYDVHENWQLKKHFGNEPHKLPEEIFNPQYQKMCNNLKGIKQYLYPAEETINDEAENKETNADSDVTGENNAKQSNPFQEHIPFDSCHLKFFLISDLLIDEKENRDDIIKLIKEKFKKWDNLSDFFFIIFY